MGSNGYLRSIFTGAFRSALADFGLSSRGRFITTVLVAIIVLALGLLVTGIDLMDQGVQAKLLAIAAALSVFVIWFLVRLAQIPPRREARLVEEKERAFAIIADILAHEQVIERLIELHRAGSEAYYTFKPYPIWLDALEKWHSEVEAIIRVHFGAADLHRLRRLGQAGEYCVAWDWPEIERSEAIRSRMLFSRRLMALDDFIPDARLGFLGLKAKAEAVAHSKAVIDKCA